MNTKKCTRELKPEPPPPDVCKLHRIKELKKAGVKVCEEPLIPEPPPPPDCFGLCIEKIKNPPITINIVEEPIVCTVAREVTGTSRCQEIEDAVAAHPDLPWPGCPPIPSIPPPPSPDPCEEQDKRRKLEECRERMKRYLE